MIKVTLILFFTIVYAQILIGQVLIEPVSIYNFIKLDNIKRDTSKNKMSIIIPKSIETKANPSKQSNDNLRIIDNNDVRILPTANHQNEAHISINKNNPNNLIASANTITLNGFGGGNINQGEYYTTNGGINWQGNDFIVNNNGLVISGDPSTAFNASNRGIIATMYDITACAANGYATHSTLNQGLNYNPLTIAATTGCYDKEMIASDNEATSPFANNIYAAWSFFGGVGVGIQFNRSINNGVNYSAPIFLANGIGQGTNVQTGPNGEVYVCWADYNGGEVFSSGLGFCRSLDGGINFSVAQRPINYVGIRVQGANPIFNSIRVNDFPSMAVDKSNGPNRGRIYIVVPVREAGVGKAVIQLSFSDNQGATWSNLQTISIPTGRQNWFPWITVDDCTGDVWATYYSFDTPFGFLTNTYVAHSANGGINWENQRVSDVSHTTSPINLMGVAAGYSGDYIGIAAYGGKAFPIWMDDRTGNWQLYCSPVTSDIADKVTINGPNEFCINGSYSLTGLPAGYSVSWSTSNSLIATITGSGTTATVNKISNGNCNIIATFNRVGIPCTLLPTIISKNINVGIFKNITISENSFDCYQSNITANTPIGSTLTWTTQYGALIDGQTSPYITTNSTVTITSPNQNSDYINVSYSNGGCDYEANQNHTFCPCPGWENGTVNWIWGAPANGEPLIVEITEGPPNAIYYKWYINGVFITQTSSPYLWTYNWPCVFEGEGVTCVAYVNNSVCGGEVASLPRSCGNYSPICYSYKASSNITAFPNPAIKDVTVKLKEINKLNKVNLKSIKEIRIIDKMNITKKLFTNLKSITQFNIDISTLKNDIYFIIVSDGIKEAKVPLIIKR